MTEPRVIKTVPANDGLDRAGQRESENQFKFAYWGDEIALVQSARLVINVDDAAANHRGNENRQHDDARQEKLDVRHVRVDFDHVESHVTGGAWRDGRRII